MAFTLNQHVEGDASVPEKSAVDQAFEISSEPVVSHAERLDPETEASESDLPKSYGGPALYLMPRDPETLFAYWDVDWRAAFQDGMPTKRKVHLRILKADGTEETAQEIEPMAGSCYVTVSNADALRTGDLGFYQPAQVWHSVAVSAAVEMPRASGREPADAEFATIPLHLSFQRMIDAFRRSHHESASLTSMLSELRERSAANEQSTTLTNEEREIVRVLDLAATPSGKVAATPTSPAPAPDLWARMKADRVLGFGATSPAGGFGSSSRAL